MGVDWSVQVCLVLLEYITGFVHRTSLDLVSGYLISLTSYYRKASWDFPPQHLRFLTRNTQRMKDLSDESIQFELAS